MSDTPTSGVEAPSRFMMGLEGDDTSANDEAMDAAIRQAFDVDANDVTVGNPDHVVDNSDGADGGDGNEPSADGVTTTTEPTGTAVDGDVPPEDGVQGQGGEVNSDVATGEGLDFATLFTQRYGRAPVPEELEGLIALADWANNLTPEQQQAINNALSPVAGGGQGQAQSEGSVPPPSSEPDPLIEQYGEDDPLVQRLKQQEQELTQLRTSYQQRYAEETRQDAVRNINLASDAFRSAREDITDADMDRLQGAVTSAGIFPAFVQAANGNVQAAMSRALDWAYWQDETFREREIAKRVAERPAVQAAHETRKNKAASVTGTGGNGASRTEAPNGKTADPWAQVAEGLREAQANGIPS